MIQTVNVNVAAQPTSGGPESFLVLSQNENGRQIRFRILGDDLPAGCTATFSGTKPDGNVYSASGTIDGNFVLLDEEIQMTAVAGRWDAKLSIAKGTENIMTSLIRVTVVADAVSGDSIPSDSELDGIVAECRSYAEAAKNEAYGSPLTASTAAAMTDQSRVYVYTGSETGYTSGHWYYYNGTAWADGGVYNAVAVDTDTTLSIAGKAADAKATGDEISSIKEDLNDLINSAYVTDSASGSVAHFVDGANDVPMKSVKVNIAPVQSGSGDPSPSNVRAISGWNAVRVYHSGENTEEATEYNVSLASAGTVYGGTLDAVSGVLTVDKAVVDLGSLTWTYSSATPRFHANGLEGVISQVNNNEIIDGLSTMYKVVSFYDLYTQFKENGSIAVSKGKALSVINTAYTDAALFKTAMSGQMFVYPLANPQTYQLTPTEIKSLLGINNVWSDAGDVEVEYRADTKLYIDKRLAEVTS